MTVALVLLAVAAVILGVLFILGMGFGYTEAWWVFFYITLSLVCLCSYIGFGFAIAGLCAAVRAKKADEPKAKGLILLSIAKIVLIYAGSLLMLATLVSQLE